MRNEEISLNTKQELSAALKWTMEKKPLSKITVSELVRTCDINRNTFYYHFNDIYDLLKWTFEQKAIEVVKKINLLVNTEEAIRFVLDYVDKNQHIIRCAYDSIGYGELKRFFYADMVGIVRHAIDGAEREATIKLPADFKEFLSEFFTEALAGMMINWVHSPKKQTKEEIVQNLMIVLQTTLSQLIR